MRYAKPLLAVVTAFAQLSCFGRTGGDLAANKTGELNRPLAERALAAAPLLTACGSGAMLAGGAALQRKPYLQQTTSNSALVLFTRTSEKSAEGASAALVNVPTASGLPKVRVTTPDGTLVTEVEARIDTSVQRSGLTQHEANIGGLEPDTLYCYEVVGATERTGFKTAPGPTTDKPVRFVAFGDSGSGGWEQKAVMRQFEAVPMDFMVHLGDIAYEDGKRDELERHYFDVYAPLLKNFAVFPVSGNHDYATEEAAPFREAFALPENGGSGGVERWYSYDWGSIHFVALDTERMGPEQAAWLEQNLAANRLPWTIVLGHRPPYSSGEHGSSGAFRDHFVPILERHRVALVLSGHEHDYERTRVLDGVTYIVTGGGGRETREVGSSAFTAFAEAVLHFTYVEVTSEAITLHAIDGLGREFDQAYIPQRR